MPVMMNAKAINQRTDGIKIPYKPFFTSLEVLSSTSSYLHIKNGAIFNQKRNQREIKGRMEIRMGGYEKGGAVAAGSYILPLDLSRVACMNELSKNATAAFWECTKDFESRLGDTLGKRASISRDKYIYFSREKPSVYIEKDNNFEFPLEGYGRALLDLSKKFLRYEGLLSHEIAFNTQQIQRYFLNSESSKIYTSSSDFELKIELNALDEEDYIIPYLVVFHRKQGELLPTPNEILKQIKKAHKNLQEIVHAPKEKNDGYPTIMCPKNHGVLFHEVFGHSAEAHRMQADDDEDSFLEYSPVVTLLKDRIGEQITPDFITLVDDPGRKDMYGYYKFDNEGIPAQKVCLIENGKLKNYIHDRQSAGYYKTQSNGHGISSETLDPCVRQSNLIVSSNREYTLDQLKSQLREECLKRGKKYGLIFEGVGKGEAMPEDCFYNTFPVNIFRMYTNGKKERVRGVYVVGTPDETFPNILATGNDYDSFRGLCGAESGDIPGEERAPSLLLGNLGVNQINFSTCFDNFGIPIISFPKQKHHAKKT